MTQTTQSASVSSMPTKHFERVYGVNNVATSVDRCRIYTFEEFTSPPPAAPTRHSTVSDLVAEWEQDAQGHATLQEGRQWVADAFYTEDGDTVRTLRLRKGWSQTRLADMVATSQSHIARIERGTENVSIQTCRKLARALEIDLNTLDQALKRQEAITQAKQQ